jgi:hypothetical protein
VQKLRSALFIHLLIIFKGVHELSSVGFSSFWLSKRKKKMKKTLKHRASVMACGQKHSLVLIYALKPMSSLRSVLLPFG